MTWTPRLVQEHTLHHMSTICAPCVHLHDMCTVCAHICAPCVHRVCTICAPYVHRVCTYVHRVCIICAPCVHISSPSWAEFTHHDHPVLPRHGSGAVDQHQGALALLLPHLQVPARWQGSAPPSQEHRQHDQPELEPPHLEFTSCSPSLVQMTSGRGLPMK